MVVDAARRQAEYYWFLIIVLFAPIGGMIYYFAVRMRAIAELRQEAPRQLAQVNEPVGPSLSELRVMALESPSIANRLAYADALRGARDFETAVGEYEFVLQRDKKCREALHGIATSLLEIGKTTRAVDYLTQLMDIDPRYRDYQAAIDYAEALWLDNRRELSLEVLHDIANTSTRLAHSLVLANYLALAEDKEQAKSVLQNALKDYQDSPPFIQRRDRQDAKDAQRLLEQLV